MVLNTELAKNRRSNAEPADDRRFDKDMEEISQSGLFDPQFYLATNPDVARGAYDPLLHFLHHGAKEGRAPHVLFDPNYYATSLRSTGQVSDNPLLHFLRTGHKRGLNPHPLFDIAFYRQQTGKHFINENPLSHFLNEGHKNGFNPHPLFDIAYYRKIAGSQLSHENPLLHFLANAQSTRLSPHPLFDTDFYLNQNPDIVDIGCNPLVQYILNGARENRWPNRKFNPIEYRRKISPLVTDNPLIDFVLYGQKPRYVRRFIAHLDGKQLLIMVAQSSYLLLFSALCFLHAFRRSRIDTATNTEHRFSSLKFWWVSTSRFCGGCGNKVRLGVPTYLTHQMRQESPQSHAQRISKAPFYFAQLYLANVFKIQGFFADAEFLLRQLITQAPVSDLALASLGDMLIVQATWAREFEIYGAAKAKISPWASAQSITSEPIWGHQTFTEGLAFVQESLRVNDQNTDAQSLLCYGYMTAGNYRSALECLNRYPGQESQPKERNLLRARATFGMDADKGTELSCQRLGNLSKQYKVAVLQLIDTKDIPTRSLEKQVCVTEPTQLSVQSRLVRNGQAFTYTDTLCFGPSYVSKFNNAEVIPEYGAVVADGKFLVRETCHLKPCHIPLFHPCIQEINGDSALICTTTPKAFDEVDCIYIGRNNNYYHWLIEELPRLGLIEKARLFQNSPILMDKGASSWQYELLSLLGIEKTRLRSLDFSYPVAFKNLVVPSYLSRDMVAHPRAVSFIRNKLLQSDHDLKPTIGKRIYISRGTVTAHRAVLNEGAIRDQFRRANFRFVNTGSLSIAEQIELFADAEVIAGSAGAGLTNVIFAPKAVRLLSLGSGNSLSPTFASITSAIGQASWQITGPGYARPYPYWIWTPFDFEIDEKDIDFVFNQIL